MPDKKNLGNIFSDIPDRSASEIFDSLFKSDSFHIERIVSQGQASEPGFWYDQDQDEWVLLLSGAATLMFENQGEPLDMKPGDYIHIPAHRKHRVEWTSPGENTVWLAIHYTA